MATPDFTRPLDLAHTVEHRRKVLLCFEAIARGFGALTRLTTRELMRLYSLINTETFQKMRKIAWGITQEKLIGKSNRNLFVRQEYYLLAKNNCP